METLELRLQRLIDSAIAAGCEHALEEDHERIEEAARSYAMERANHIRAMGEEAESAMNVWAAELGMEQI